MVNVFSQDLFTKDTLTDSDYKFFAIFFSILITIILIVSKQLTSSAKSLSWCISLVNAAIMVVASIVYISVNYESIVQKLSDLEPFTDIFHNKNDFSSLVCLWFALTNVFDILFGVVFYPKYLNFLTAWIHHPVYMYIMYFAITGNGFIATSRPFAPSFILASLEELPTFILALGSIEPKFRTDLGFGISFFLTRIFYHVLLFGYAIYSKCDIPTYVIYTLALLLHLFWFSSWVTKYAKPATRDGKSKQSTAKHD